MDLSSERKYLALVVFFALVFFAVIGFPYPAPADTAEVNQANETKHEAVAPAGAATQDNEKPSATLSNFVEKSTRGLADHLKDAETCASLDFGMLGVSWLGLMAFFLILVLTAILDRVISRWIQRQLQALASAEKPPTARVLFLDALSKPLSLFIWVYGLYAALSIILVQLPATPETKLVQSAASRAADLGGALAVIWLAYRLIVLSDVQVKEWAGKSKSKIDELLVSIVGKSLRIAIVLIGGVMVLQNVTEIQMGPLIASLGLGGLAIALAAKDYVANFLGTLTLIFDKPFQIGDQVVLDKFEGTVDSVGFRSTRIRTADGSLLSIPNSKVIDSPLQNVTRRLSIRWQTTIGISFENPPEKVNLAVEILKEVLRNHEGMREELPPRIFFDAFKDWSLNITILAWYHPPNWWDYQEWVQRTCMTILERFRAADIKFALPTQVVQFPSTDNRQAERTPEGKPQDAT